MLKATPSNRLLTIAILSLFFLSSCNNQIVDVPFPVSDSGYPQPVTQKLQFSAPKTLGWTTVTTGKIKPSVRKFDLSKVPTTPYDPSNFQPLKNTPEKVSINFQTLPDSAFNLNNIPSKPLNFVVSVLPPPTVLKAGSLNLKGGARLSVSDWGLTLGLQGQNILSLLTDRAGLVWISTDKGLYRFDGEYIQKYNITGVVSILEDKAGRFWGLSEQGIGYIDLRKGEMHFSTAITTPFPRLPRITMDHKGQIWVAQIEGKFAVVIDPEANTFKRLESSNGISGTRIWGVFEDAKHNIWLSTSNGIDIIHPESGRISRLRKTNGLTGDSVMNVQGDLQGHIWAGYKNGAYSMIDPDQNSITNYGVLQDYETVVTYRYIFNKKGKVWLATNHGLIILDPINNTIKYPKEQDGVPKDFILDMMADQRQRIWIGTYLSGLFLLDNDAQITNPVGSPGVSSLFEDASDKLWIGTTNSGIRVVDPERKVTFDLNKQMGFNESIIQSISAVDGNIWITSNGGLDIIDQDKKTVEHWGKNEGLHSDVVYSILKDSKGNIWNTGPTEGIELIDSTRMGTKLANKATGLNDNSVTNLREDGLGRVWIATEHGGINVIDPKDWSVRYLNNLPGLQDSCFRTVLRDKYDRMWIGTDKGVYVADLKAGTITTINATNGLSDNYVSSLIEYKDVMVVGTHSKVNIVTPPVPAPDRDSTTAPGKWKVALLSNSEGLNMTNVTWDVNIITHKGKYIWGDAGLTIINEIKEASDTTFTYVTGMNISNQSMKFSSPKKEKDSVATGYVRTPGVQWDSVSGPYNMPENLVLPYDQNFIQFQFAQNHLGRLDPALYSYILLGIDKQWSRFENKTFTDNYLNLPSGKYIFQVRSKNVNGSWTPAASFHFAILPPWWKSWWAWAIYALMLAGLVWVFIHYRSKKLLNENRLLEDRVMARTKEVQQQAEELSTVNQISQALVSQADLHDLITLVGDQLRDLFKANIVYIALLDKKSKIISFPYQHGDQMPPLKLGEGLTSKIILSGQPLLINKDVHDHANTLGIDRVGIPASSYLGVPIPVSDEIIGVLSIQSTETENRFAEKDKRLLTTIAANVGVAIRKARLFEEVKLANSDADAARKNAEEANAAKSAFLSTVSHELRTPLTSVLGFAKITKKRLEEKIFPITDKSDPKTIKTIEQISNNLSVVISEGERLTNLINDVLDLAKIEAGKMEWNMEPVPIPEIVERAIAATSSLFDQKNLKLDRKIESNLPAVSGDRDKLIQVVVNLLSNAVKFTNAGTVTCSVFQKDGAIVVGITDTGIGIAPSDQDKVFEQFKQVGDTLTDKPKGTGLGLPICKEIVEHHNGKLWLESALGQGSTFYFSLPVVPSDEKAVSHIQLNDLVRQLKKRMQQSHPSMPIENATILVVDDDDGIRNLLKQELTEAGYAVEEAANGKEALDKIRTHRPDLIILDVMMPEMNGFDVAAILKNDPQTMEIPIIILSVVQDKSRGFRIGVDRYLTKPIDTGLLFSEIGNLLEQGKSRKKVLVVDEDSVTIRTLSDVLEAKGYQVVESDGKELVEKAIAAQPDIIILNSLISDKQEIVRSLRFEKGLENVLFLIYQ